MTPLAKVAKTRERADQARSAFEEAIHDAHTAGHSARTIAPAAGLSHQRIHQILHGK